MAMVVGSSVNYFWMLRNPAGFDMYMFAIAAGLLAGEGLGGVFQALLAIIGADGGSKSIRCTQSIHASDAFVFFSFSEFGTAIGCPGMEFCG